MTTIQTPPANGLTAQQVADLTLTTQQVADLSRAFDLVAPQDWRGPIAAEICPEARAITAEAIAFYTAPQAHFSALPNGLLRVTAIGYRSGPAGP